MPRKRCTRDDPVHLEWLSLDARDRQALEQFLARVEVLIPFVKTILTSRTAPTPGVAPGHVLRTRRNTHRKPLTPGPVRRTR